MPSSGNRWKMLMFTSRYIQRVRRGKSRRRMVVEKRPKTSFSWTSSEDEDETISTRGGPAICWLSLRWKAAWVSDIVNIGRWKLKGKNVMKIARRRPSDKWRCLSAKRSVSTKSNLVPRLVLYVNQTSNSSQKQSFLKHA